MRIPFAGAGCFGTGFAVLSLLALVGTVIGSVIQWVTIIRLGYAYFGFIGGFLGMAILWPLPWLPSMLVFSLVRNMPDLWNKPQIGLGRKLFFATGIFIAILALAGLIHQGVSLAIGWAANIDPCLSWQSGVTGSIPPGPECV